MAMLDELTPPVRGLILDMDGVLWQEDTPIGDLAAIFARIHSRGLLVALATNNATLGAGDYSAKLRGFGAVVDSARIITSAAATAELLAERFRPLNRAPSGRAVFVLGEGGILDALRAKGFSPLTDPLDESRPLAVVSSFDRSLTFAKLRRATLHVRAGAPLFATNADRTFPTPQGLVPGAGSILAALEAAGDVRATVVGKPAVFMMQLAASAVGLSAAEVLAVGDRLETDIAGGQAFGARTALVLSGVTSAEAAAQWRPKPDLVAKDLAELVR